MKLMVGFRNFANACKISNVIHKRILLINSFLSVKKKTVNIIRFLVMFWPWWQVY
jgi:hypothetical protein